MKKRNIFVLAAGCLCAMLMIGGTVAYFTDEATAVNVIKTGKIGISLTEDNFDLLTDKSRTVDGIVPGDTIKKDPLVIVDEDSMDCYIRIKMDIESDLSAANQELLISNLDVQPGWVKGEDGYYYYKDIVSALEKIPFFTKVVIPEDWDNDTALEQFKINLKAEAIQSAHLTVEKDKSGNIVKWNATP